MRSHRARRPSRGRADGRLAVGKRAAGRKRSRTGWPPPRPSRAGRLGPAPSSALRQVGAPASARAVHERCDTGLARLGNNAPSRSPSGRFVPKRPWPSPKDVGPDAPKRHPCKRWFRSRAPGTPAASPTATASMSASPCDAVICELSGRRWRKLAGELLVGWYVRGPGSRVRGWLAGPRRTSRLKPHPPWPADSQSAAPRQDPASDLPLTRPGPRRAPPGPALYGGVAAGGNATAGSGSKAAPRGRGARQL